MKSETTLMVEPLDEHVVLLTMNRPRALNALNYQMIEELRIYFQPLSNPGNEDPRVFQERRKPEFR